MQARPLLLAAAFLLSGTILADEIIQVEFEPRVGAMGARVMLKTPVPANSVVRFGSRIVPLVAEAGGRASFIVPVGATTAFLEVRHAGRIVAKSAVPFVVSGSSLVSTPKLVGLKEAIDVFGYSEARPEGGERPDTPVKPVLTFDETEVLTLGESPPPRMLPAVELGDAASAGRTGMGPAGFLFTARAPKKKTPTPSN